MINFATIKKKAKVINLISMTIKSKKMCHHRAIFVGRYKKTTALMLLGVVGSEIVC